MTIAPVPAVINAVKNPMIRRMRPLVTEMRTREMTAPPRIPKPTGRDRIPIATRSLPGGVSFETKKQCKELTVDVVDFRWPEEKYVDEVRT